MRVVYDESDIVSSNIHCIYESYTLVSNHYKHNLTLFKKEHFTLILTKPIKLTHCMKIMKRNRMFIFTTATTTLLIATIIL